MNLNFIILYVQDINKEKAFYTEIVGLQVVEAHSGPSFVTLQPSAGPMIGLQDRSEARFPPRQDKPGSLELSFAVEDVDGTWQQWKEKGVELLSEPMNLPFGRYFIAKDPEGYYLSVYRYAQKNS